MSSQVLNLKIKGLFTSFNEFSEVPEGALQTADNIDIIQDSVAQPRRGFDRDAGGYSDSADRTDALVEFQDKKIAHHGTYGSADALSYYSGSTWTSIEAASAISNKKMKFLGADRNLLYTTSTGVRVLGAYNGTPRAAGAYKGLDVQATTSASAASFLGSAGDSVAYRVVWLYIDENDNYHYGAPSQREVFTVSDTTKGVDVRTTIPAGVTTAWFVQLYRSATAASGTTPSDELQLVYETNPTSTNISNKYITITDILPSALRGATIYTASSQEGIGAANEQPPLAADIAHYDGCAFYYNIKSKHRFFLTVLATGASSGVQVDDTITIGGITYTAKSSETVASAQFKVFTGGTAAVDIADTAKSLVKVINQHASSTVYAYYISGYADLPGQILLEERAVGGASFAVTTSRATCWNPTNIPTSGTASSSSNDTRLSGVAFSKPGQSEAVPLTNFLNIGTSNIEGMRCIDLTDGVYFFRKNGEVYKLTGSYPNYSVDKIEDSLKLVAPESLQVLNNVIYGLFDQGVCQVSDSTKVLSRPIEQDLISLVNQNYSLVQSTAFGCAYESDRKYYIFLPSTSADTTPTQAYVYNTFTNTWVRHTLNATCGLVDGSNNLFFGHGASNYLFKERKTYSFLDYADFGFSCNVTANSGTYITIDSGFDNLAVGDIIYQSSTVWGLVSALDPVTQQITLDYDPGITVAAATALKGIDATIKWVPTTLGNPSILKQFHTASLLFKSDFIGTGYLTFRSDLSAYDESVTLTGRGLGLWGLFGWGGEPWGGESNKRPLRQLVPRRKQRCSQLTISFSHAWGFSNWVLQGIAVFGEADGEKVSRV